MRLPVDLLARLDERVGARGRTAFVIEAVEKALGSGMATPVDEGRGRKDVGTSAPPRPPGVKTAAEVMYVCRHGDFRAASPKARCPHHGGALVPE